MDNFGRTQVTVNTVGTTPTGATLAPNRLGHRISWYVKNVSSGGAAAATIDIFCGENVVLTLNAGDYNLDPKQSVIDSNGDKYQCWQGAIRAISSIDAAAVIISERVG